MGKSVSYKSGQNFLTVLKIYNRRNKNCIKKRNSKKSEATSDLIGNKTADKITSILKKYTKKLPNDETEADRYSWKDASKANSKFVRQCIK